ncbi:hypothetical protein B5K11_09840 [Rhizobium leguminosarum bv. trifolii]|nr:hypothetical protein B5K11_09840 [Rhizobium leguminosarum bv. trifolii]
MQIRGPQDSKVIDDASLDLNPCCRCKPDARYGPTSVISCSRCGKKITVDTAPFFRDSASQREHETWRAVETWNKLSEATPADDPPSPSPRGPR